GCGAVGDHRHYRQCVGCPALRPGGPRCRWLASRERAMRGPLSKRIVLWLMVGAGLLFLSLPTIVILGASFTAGEIMQFPPQGLSLRWYQSLLDSTAFQHALLRSLFVGLICMLIATPVGTLCGIAMVR